MQIANNSHEMSRHFYENKKKHQIVICHIHFFLFLRENQLTFHMN